MEFIDHLPLFILLALIAEILGTVGGFGSSLFFIPIASYFLDFHSVLGITAIFHVSSNITKIAFFRKGFDKQVIIWLGIPAVVCVIIGAYLSKFAPTEALETGLAVFLISTSIIFLVFNNLNIRPTTANSIGGGVLSGLLAGILGTGGAIRGIVLTAYKMRTEVFIATSAIIDLGIDASRSVVYALNGYVHTHDLYLIPILLVVSILGTWIGKKILERFSEEQFRSSVLVLVLLTGLFTLGRVILN